MTKVSGMTLSVTKGKSLPLEFNGLQTVHSKVNQTLENI